MTLLSALRKLYGIYTAQSMFSSDAVLTRKTIAWIEHVRPLFFRYEHIKNETFCVMCLGFVTGHNRDAIIHKCDCAVVDMYGGNYEGMRPEDRKEEPRDAEIEALRAENKSLQDRLSSTNITLSFMESKLQKIRETLKP